MNRAEQNVEIASRMYTCRRQLRQLLSSNYHGAAKQYMEAIVAYSESKGVSLMTATLQLSVAMHSQGESTGVSWLMAACVELLEPDEESPVLVNFAGGE